MSDADVVNRRLAEHGLIDAVTGDTLGFAWSLMTTEQRIAAIAEIYAGTAWSVTGNADGTITWTYEPPVDAEGIPVDPGPPITIERDDGGAT